MLTDSDRSHLQLEALETRQEFCNLRPEVEARLVRLAHPGWTEEPQWSVQSHLQPIHVVVQFLEGTGCQLLFPPGLGSSLLLCGWGTLVTMCHNEPDLSPPNPILTKHGALP